MGRDARVNPRSVDGRKWAGVVERSRLERAPVSTLLKVLVAMVAPAVAAHFRLVDHQGRPVYREAIRG